MRNSQPLCHPVTWLALLLIAGWALVACQANAERPLLYVDLSQRSPLPSMASTAKTPLRMAVGAILSPQGTVESYDELAEYLSEHIDRPVEIVQRKTYAEINQLIDEGKVDVAFVCTSAYLDGMDAGFMELLVAPTIDNRSVYHSVLIVPTDSNATAINDLAGATFAFTDPMSLSGRVYPTHLLQEEDISPEDFFGKIIYTYGHDRAIEAVAAGVADGAAVDSLVLNYAFQRNPELRELVRIIHTSPAYGIPPVVVPTALSTIQRSELQTVFLEMVNDPLGRQVLDHLGIDRFVRVDEELYASARVLVSTTPLAESGGDIIP
jgi:phosphonate transport system substrate-binding protein